MEIAWPHIVKVCSAPPQDRSYLILARLPELADNDCNNQKYKHCDNRDRDNLVRGHPGNPSA
jgi:hypothetical protein